MVDFQSRYRLYSLGYTGIKPRASAITNRDLYRESADHVFRTPRPAVHDCRADIMKEHTERRDWEASILARGLRQTYDNADRLHRQDIPDIEGARKKPDKLLLTTGKRGSKCGDFRYPRHVAVTLDGDIIVADTGNNRVQIFNAFGVFKTEMGSHGKENGRFNEPSSVTELPNGDIGVADKNNKRIQVFAPEGKFKYAFTTVDHPYSIDCDRAFNIIVGTTAGTIEVYRRGGKLLHRFDIGGRRKTPIRICANDKEEVVICDSDNNLIKFYSYEGKPLYKFHLQASGEGLAVIASGICLNPLGQILVVDSLNHTVNLYSERGTLLQQVVCPVDGTGAMQSCCIGPEGHLIVTECSITAEHCLKVFRYRECTCHYQLPDSSKRNTPDVTY